MEVYDPRLSIVRFEAERKIRCFNAFPVLAGDTNFGVFNSSVDVAATALSQRYFKMKGVDGILRDPIQPIKGVFRRAVMLKFAKKITGILRSQAHVYSHQEVVEMYTGPKKQIYQKAYMDYLHNGITRSDATLSTFIKFEKTNLDKAPRMIQPRKPVYNLCLARYLKKSEKIIYKAINTVFKHRTPATVIKGMDCYESAKIIRQKWDLFHEPVAIGGDISKLDMHISVAALQFEHMIYNSAFNSKTLKKLLRWQVKNYGRSFYADGMIKFKTNGKRSSGDINTSTGNTIIVCSVVYYCLTTLGLNAELIDNGDDFVVITEKINTDKIVKHFPHLFAEFGLPLVMETPVYEFEHLEFCQTKPVYDGVEWRMCRNALTSFAKDPICLIPINNLTILREWCRAIGEAGYNLTAGLPILPKFYSMFMRASPKVRDSIRYNTFRNTSYYQNAGVAVKRTAITTEARVSFYNAFGILPDVQVAIENYFDTTELMFNDNPHLGGSSPNLTSLAHVWATAGLCG